MKILEIVPELNSGGGERFVVDICNELCHNNDVTLVTLFSVEKMGFYRNDLDQSVKVISFDKKLGFDLSVIIKLTRLIRKVSPDIVHTHMSAVEYAFLSTLTYRKPRYYHTIHSDARAEVFSRGRRLVCHYSFKRGLIHPVTISNESEKSFFDVYSFDTTMIVNGRNVQKDLEPAIEVAHEFEEYRKRGRVLVQLATIYPVKRQDMMARVAKRLQKAGYDFTLLMIGRVDDKGMEQSIINENCPYVHILGPKRNPLDYLKLADAFCLCSDREGMPMSLIEALGMGAVPVCTPVGGIVNTVENGVNGFLSKDISEDAYYEAMESFLKMTDEELEKMKQHTLASYEPYSMTECAHKYEELFIKS